MHIRSLASWLLLSYFTPFITFFFGIFWFGLNVWLFLIGMLVVSLLTLSLFLKVKDWEMRMYRLLRSSEQAVQNRPTILAKPLTRDHTIPSIETLLEKTPHHVLDLIARDVKASYKSLELDHERIVAAYEDERSKLFNEITETKHKLQKEQSLISAKDQYIQDREDEIKNLKAEMEILLGMDQELLRSAVS